MGYRLEKGISTWRKVAMAAWDPPNDPTVYGTLTLDAGPALAYLARVRQQSGVKVTITHLVGRAVAIALRETPDINGRIVGRRLFMRDTVDIFYQVVMEGGKELSGAKIERADEKDVYEIAGELVDKAQRIRDRRDPQFETSRSAIDRIPGVLRRPVLRFLSYLTSDRGISLPSLKLPADPFGSAMVTSVGMFGIDIGYSPIFPLSGTPIIILVGEVQERPVAQDGNVVVRPMLNLNVSFDHRFIDGFHAGRMSRSVRRYFAAPEEFEVKTLKKLQPPEATAPA